MLNEYYTLHFPKIYLYVLEIIIVPFKNIMFHTNKSRRSTTSTYDFFLFTNLRKLFRLSIVNSFIFALPSNELNFLSFAPVQKF